MGGSIGNNRMWPWTLTSPMTFTWDFQDQMLKESYLRNGRAHWHGTKWMWIDRMLDPLCDLELWPHPWPWHWIFTCSLSNFKIAVFPEWVVCLILWNERGIIMNSQRDGYYAWLWSMILPMTLTWDLRSNFINNHYFSTAKILLNLLACIRWTIHYWLLCYRAQ